MVKGHFLACACDIFGVSGVDEQLILPPDILKATKHDQLAFIMKMARMVVDRCSLIESAYTGETGSEPDGKDGVYNYACVLCHFGSLVMEFRDAWAEGDGERVHRCWKLFLPHFRASGRTKYSLQALRVQMQANVVLSPNLAHQVLWNRFVNLRGGAGNNIPCDLYNEHINKQLKYIILNMGSNLTETALQRAARSVTTLQQICGRFDAQSGVPHIGSSHSTKPDTDDVKKVVKIVLKNKLLVKMKTARQHRSFPGMALNPLHNWDLQKTKEWIEAKKTEYIKYKYKYKGSVHGGRGTGDQEYDDIDED